MIGTNYIRENMYRRRVKAFNILYNTIKDMPNSKYIPLNKLTKILLEKTKNEVRKNE